MKRLAYLLMALCLVFALSMGASADQVEQSGLHASVSEDGSCQVSMSVSLFMEVPDRTMRFPIPQSATNVQLNGAGVGTYQSGTSQYVDLSSVISTDNQNISFTLRYTLPNVVVSSNGIWTLDLPLLCGFQLPISAFDFTVSLPGNAQGKPSFTSGYHQSNIEKDLHWSVTGSVVSGRATNGLNDYETLQMTMRLDGSMFSFQSNIAFDTEVDDIALQVCLILAILYWIIFMRTPIPKLHRSAHPPQGYTAGHFASVLTLQGADLSLMVLSWAQMGYIVLERNSRGGILLHKRMDMGNERSHFEMELFRRLFRKRSIVDTGSLAYALLCSKVARQIGPAKALAHKRNGNPKFFLLLCAMVSLFSGVSAGLALGTNASWQVMLIILFSICGFATAWVIQQGAQGVLLYKPGVLLRSLLAAALWVGIYWMCNQLGSGIQIVLFQFVAGLLGLYGGRRTEEGRRNLEQVLSLDLYFRTAERTALQKTLKNNPAYFHDLAPYALALNADAAFANRFGKVRLMDCPYLAGIAPAERNAAQWCRILRNTVDSMNARYVSLKKEQILKTVGNLRK